MGSLRMDGSRPQLMSDSVRHHRPTWVTSFRNSTGDTTVQLEFTAVFREVPEGYVGFVEELPGANTQGETLDETRANLREAAQLVLEANRVLIEEELHGESVIREPLSIPAA